MLRTKISRMGASARLGTRTQSTQNELGVPVNELCGGARPGWVVPHVEVREQRGDVFGGHRNDHVRIEVASIDPGFENGLEQGGQSTTQGKDRFETFSAEFAKLAFDGNEDGIARLG